MWFGPMEPGVQYVLQSFISIFWNIVNHLVVEITVSY